MRCDDQFDIYYLNKDDRLNFLFMAVKHPILGRFKDIRLYLAKWFFYDVVNVLDRLVGLTCTRYMNLEIEEAILWVKSELSPMFGLLLKTPIFYKLLQKPWFWGCCFHQSHHSYNSINGFVYLCGSKLWCVALESDSYDECYDICSEKILELMDKLDK
jgi:hypothetical protein